MVESSDAVLTEAVEDSTHQFTEFGSSVVTEWFEHQVVDGGGVARCSCCEHGESFVGQLGECASAIVVASHSTDPAPRLEAAHGMGQAAS
jgi:hypothetical protein